MIHEPQETPIRDPQRFWLLLGGGAAILGIVAAISAWQGARIHRPQIAIAALEDAWGKVSTVPIGPRWLRRWVGDKRMQAVDRVTRVDFSYGPSDFPDSALGEISGLPHVKEILLNSQTSNFSIFERR